MSLSDALFLVAAVVFGFEVFRSRSLVAGGLAVQAVAFLLKGGI